MKALVAYESMYGNTHAVATAIAKGLTPSYDVLTVCADEATRDQVARADLLVVGGPTHVHGMSRRATRKAAVEAAHKPNSGLHLDPHATGVGLRELFASLPRTGTKAAAFDTRLHGPAFLTGRASKRIARLLRTHGFSVVTRPESFVVTKANTLETGEEQRAFDWGKRLAATCASIERSGTHA
jgi:Flavodoxin domain